MTPIGGFTSISASGPLDLVSMCQLMDLGRSFWAVVLVVVRGCGPFIALPRSSHGAALFYPHVTAHGTYIRPGPLVSRLG
jgi:hypothetical protein